MKNTGFKIRQKIILAFAFCFLSVLLFAIFSFQTHREMGRRLKLVEVTDDLVNNILEVRRFEKNFFLYKHSISLNEALTHLNEVERLYLRNQDHIVNLSEENMYPEFYDTLICYRDTLLEMKSVISREGADIRQLDLSVTEESLRILGQSLLDMSGDWDRQQRNRIESLFRRALYLLVSSMILFVILGIVVASYISRMFTTPLIQMKQAMEKIAEGDYTPIPETMCRSEEFSPLFKAFNRMIDELEARQEQLVQTRKISAIGTFTSGIAHELNNPVNNIVLTAETLQEDIGTMDKEEVQALIQDIIIQSERASDIIKNLLDFSRSQKPEMGATSISSLILDTLKLVNNQLMLANVEPDINISDDLPQIYGEYKSLQQVFLNLFINAIQAMPDGGTLKICADVSGDGKFARISVTDSGVGIDPQDIHHIFDPFFTTKDVGKGTGLGLSVTYGIVRKHGGHIEAQSNKGKGATFVVTLPVAR